MHLAAVNIFSDWLHLLNTIDGILVTNPPQFPSGFFFAQEQGMTCVSVTTHSISGAP